LQGLAETEIGNTYITSRDYDSAIVRFNAVIDNDYSRDINNEAKISLANALFQQDPLENAILIQDNYRSVLSTDSNNERALQLKNNFIKLQTRGIITLANKEGKFTADDLGLIYGKGFGATQKVKDVLSIIFDPGENIYLDSRLFDKHSEFLEQQGENYKIAYRRQVAAYATDKLVDNGFDLKDFADSSSLDQFRTMYKANGYSLKEFDNLLSGAGINQNDVSTYSEGFDKLIEVIDNNPDIVAAQNFRQQVSTTNNDLVSVIDSIKNDATFYSIYSNGGRLRNVNFNGDINEAYKSIRLEGARKIEYSTGEKISIAGLTATIYAPLGIVSAARSGALSKFGVSLAKGTTIESVSRVDPRLGLGLLGGNLAKGIRNVGSSNQIDELFVELKNKQKALVPDRTRVDLFQRNVPILDPKAVNDYINRASGVREREIRQLLVDNLDRITMEDFHRNLVRSTDICCPDNEDPTKSDKTLCPIKIFLLSLILNNLYLP